MVEDDPKKLTKMQQYDTKVERMRKHEYPHMQNQLYLDHAGTTLYSATLMQRFQAVMLANVYGKSVQQNRSRQTLIGSISRYTNDQCL
jgi:molybdenum cofactor sulfurtransferase